MIDFVPLVHSSHIRPGSPSATEHPLLFLGVSVNGFLVSLHSTGWILLQMLPIRCFGAKGLPATGTLERECVAFVKMSPTCVSS